MLSELACVNSSLSFIIRLLKGSRTFPSVSTSVIWQLRFPRDFVCRMVRQTVSVQQSGHIVLARGHVLTANSNVAQGIFVKENVLKSLPRLRKCGWISFNISLIAKFVSPRMRIYSAELHTHTTKCYDDVCLTN